VITGVAFCPQAPALVPAVGRGVDAELGPVRTACREAIRRVTAPGVRLVVVGGADRAGEYPPSARGSFAGYGVELALSLGRDGGDAAAELPPSLTVGAWLVRDALGPDSGASGFATASGAEDPPDWHSGADTALVVVGDGSARRSAKAPGYADPRSAVFDADLVAALASGEAHRLRDAVSADGPAGQLAGELLVGGTSAWRLTAGQTEAAGGYRAEVLYDDAPFGVGYVVAAWTAP